MAHLSRSQLQAMAVQEERQRNVIDHKAAPQQQNGVTIIIRWAYVVKTAARMQQDSAHIRERNRNRANHPSRPPNDPAPVIHEATDNHLDIPPVGGCPPPTLGSMEPLV